jgi:hypothetical protein
MDNLLFMKKNLLIAGVALLMTAGVTATVLGTNKKTAPANNIKKEQKDVKKKECCKSMHHCIF